MRKIQTRLYSNNAATRKARFPLIAGMLIWTLISACNQTETDNDTELLALAALALSPVSMPVSLVANDQSVSCNQNFTVGTGNDTVQIKDFRVYLSEFAWITPDGEVSATLPDITGWQKDNVVLIDLEDGTGYCSGTGTADTNSQVVLSQAPANATGLAFSVGLPDTQNRLDNTTSDAPFNIAQMYWAWASGFKFANFELSADGVNAYRFHLGSIDCSGSRASDCARAMKGRIQINNVNVATGIQFDVKDWFDGLAFATQPCMGASDPTTALSDGGRCQTLRERMGINHTTGAGNPANAKGFELRQ